MNKLPLIVIILILAAANGFAQETQVPFDSAGKIEVITADMELTFRLFTTYAHFHEARLFQTSDSAYFLEVTTIDDGKLIRNRYQKTKNDVLVYQKTIKEISSDRPAFYILDQSSRSKFVIAETILSAAAYGPLLISSVNSSNVGVGTGIELIMGGSGYFLSYVLTKNSPMSDGDCSLALGGAVNGGLHGLLFDMLARNDAPGTEAGILVTGGSILETAVGYYIARKYNFSEGRSDMIRYSGFFGMGDGALISLIANTSPSASLVAGMSLLGSAGGYAAGTLLSNEQTYSRGNASVVLTAGIFAPYLTAMVYSTIVVSNPFNNNITGNSVVRGLGLSALGGNILAVIGANALMRGKNFSTGEGNDVILGTTAGFLIGTGVSYAFFSKSIFDNNAGVSNIWGFTVPSVLGTIAGFGIMVAVIGEGTGNSRDLGWNMDINPGALMGAFAKNQNRTFSQLNPPALTFQYHW